VADIWITPSRAQRLIDGDGEWGLTVRRTSANGAAKTRWIFTDITATGFNWRNEDEDEAGKITVRQRFTGRRPQS
jgi:hypothetical protein